MSAAILDLGVRRPVRAPHDPKLVAAALVHTCLEGLSDQVVADEIRGQGRVYVDAETVEMWRKGALEPALVDAITVMQMAGRVAIDVLADLVA